MRLRRILGGSDMSFENFKVGDIAEVQTGPFGSQLHQKDYTNIGTPIITVEHLGQNYIIHENTPYVSDEDKIRLNKYTLKKGDIVFSRVGSVDRRAYVSEDEDGWLFSGRCLRVRVTNEQVNAHYLSYYFGLENFKEYVRRIAVGATMPSLNTKIMKELPIQIPDIDTQEIITNILSSLDKKIKVNYQINKKLEEMAQAIFKQWFVDFEFPNEEGKPYKSSGGAMVESELGMIPEGWEVGQLSDLVEIRYGKDHKKLNEGIIPVYGSGGVMRYVDTALYTSESVLVPRKGTLNNVIYVDHPFWSVDTMFYSEMKKVDIVRYIYCYLKTKDLAAMNTGSAVPSMTTALLNSLPILIKPLDIINRFDRIVAPIFSRISMNSKEIKNLSQVRDTLLPKLMSGEILVPINQE